MEVRLGPQMGTGSDADIARLREVELHAQTNVDVLSRLGYGEGHAGYDHHKTRLDASRAELVRLGHKPLED